jgi:hypothetical protein
MIDFTKLTVTHDDQILLGKIANRAVQMARELGRGDVRFEDQMRVCMDLFACHAIGCPLKLHQLLLCANADFMHDVLGICQNIDKSSGHLTGDFWPIFAVRKRGESLQ